MRNWGGAVKWLAILAVCLYLGNAMRSCNPGINPIEATKKVFKDVTGNIPVDDPKRPLSTEKRENEIRALAAICLVDSAGEIPAVQQVACRRAMDTALRYRHKYEDDVDAIFRLAKTMYPRDRIVPTGWAERSVAFVFRPTLTGGYYKANRVRALALAKELFEGSIPEGCATHYTRANRETTGWYDEAEGAEKIRGTMIMVPESDELLKLRLYCPKEDPAKK